MSTTQNEENFEERCVRWERTIEDILIEINQETANNGLLIHIDGSNQLIEATNNLINNVRNAKGCINENLGKVNQEA